MKILLSICLSALFGAADAQLTTPLHQGVIVDRDQQVIVSELALESAFDAVIYKTSASSYTTSILPAHRVKSFRYYDAAKDINRQFVSIRKRGLYQFYEVVIQGEVQVLRRLKKFALSWAADEGYDYDFFVSYNGELFPLAKFKSTVFRDLQKKYRDELIAFVQQNKLELSEVASIFSIVKWCNQQRQDQQIVAYQESTD